MNFYEFITLEESIDVALMEKAIVKQCNGIGLTIFSDYIFYKEDGNFVKGYFVYFLNENDDRYKQNSMDMETVDYFYIGTFLYDSQFNKLKELNESTKAYFVNPRAAKEEIDRLLKRN